MCDHQIERRRDLSARDTDFSVGSHPSEVALAV
jgi:hypothetical protein